MMPPTPPVCYGEQAVLLTHENARLRDRVRKLEGRLAGVATCYLLGSLTNAQAREAIDLATKNKD